MTVIYFIILFHFTSFFLSSASSLFETFVSVLSLRSLRFNVYLTETKICNNQSSFDQRIYQVCLCTTVATCYFSFIFTFFPEKPSEFWNLAILIHFWILSWPVLTATVKTPRRSHIWFLNWIPYSLNLNFSDFRPMDQPFSTLTSNKSKTLHIMLCGA